MENLNQEELEKLEKERKDIHLRLLLLIMHMLLVIAFFRKINYGGNFSPKV